MNREKARKYAEIMMAYANGADIECFGSETWYSVNDPDFLFEQNEYRIKPEPKKRYMTRNEVLRFVTNTMGIIVRDVYSISRPANASDYAEYDDYPGYYEWAYANFNAEGEPVDGWHKFEVEE
jgi:hypothetical protein